MTVFTAAKALIALNCFQQAPVPPPAAPQSPISTQMMVAAQAQKAQEDLVAACNVAAKVLSDAVSSDKGCPK